MHAGRHHRRGSHSCLQCTRCDYTAIVAAEPGAPTGPLLRRVHVCSITAATCLHVGVLQTFTPGTHMNVVLST